MTTRQRPSIMTLAMQRFDRSAPLLDRLVRMENVMVMEVPGTVGWKGVIDGVFDAVPITARQTRVFTTLQVVSSVEPQP